MPSSLKTEHLHLNFWLENDKPVRADFVRDNSIIDVAVGEHCENTQLHLSSADVNKLRDTYQLKVLQGNGDAQRRIALNFKPTVVFYFAGDKPPAEYTSGENHVYSGMGISDYGFQGGIVITNTELIVKQAQINGVFYDLNKPGVQYYMIAVR
ncbi:MAG: hypothetical protein IIT49_06185 [Clostridia bacterium]|nr:hypothetical protein [Clostridia bacterium]MBQ5440356.1 hypothetical protein [Clostridia bacterium]